MVPASQYLRKWKIAAAESRRSLDWHLAFQQAANCGEKLHRARNFSRRGKKQLNRSGARRVGCSALPHETHVGNEEMTMAEKQARNATRATRAIGDVTEQMLERRRQINRDSMRRRRAARAEAGLPPEGRNYEISSTNANSPTDPATPAPVAMRRCAICRIRKSVEEIVRLLPCAGARSGYVKVRIPYCGFC